MKKPLIFLLTVSVGALGTLLGGCGNTQSSMTPKQQTDFGHYGQPMPQAAKDAMAKMRKGPPPGAVAPPAAKH